MKFNDEQIKLMRQHIKDIAKYIEENILPYIDYMYETPAFGPMERWGRFDENHGKRYSIKLNCHNTKVEFIHGNVPYFATDYIPDVYMYYFIKHWNDEAKLYLHEEIKKNERRINIIETFKV